MTPRQEGSIERSVGRIEAQLEALAAIIGNLAAKAELADEWRHEVRERLDRNDEHQASMSQVAKAFSALEQSIRDGKMQAKGILVGIGIAGGAAGATVATGLKWLWSAIMGT